MGKRSAYLDLISFFCKNNEIMFYDNLYQFVQIIGMRDAGTTQIAVAEVLNIS